VAKLRSTLKQIPWSLALRAAALAVIWLAAPTWLFVALALLAYFVPLFQPSRFALPFVATLVLSALTPPSVWLMPLVGVLFFAILGAKDLILIDRAGAYETSVLVLVFLSTLAFFSRCTTLEHASAFAWSFVVACVIFILLRAFGEYLATSDDAVRTHSSPRRRLLAWGVTALATWQVSLAALALPLGRFAQSAMVFATVAVLAGIELDYLRSRLDRPRLLAYAGTFTVLLGAILFSNQWGL